MGIEKTSTYIGYKILWVIKLFMDGKKFPYGYIHEKKWKAYVHDLVSTIFTKVMLEMLVTIDAEVFFQII